MYEMPAGSDLELLMDSSSFFYPQNVRTSFQPAALGLLHFEALEIHLSYFFFSRFFVLLSLWLSSVPKGQIREGP